MRSSTSATPSFLLQGDGGLSSYAISIDGSAIGTFRSAFNGVVCIQTTARLADGPHVLAGVELEPNAGNETTLSFTVDTVPPPRPSRPVLSAYTDSGRKGDGVTRFPSVNLTGTAAPNHAVQIFANGRMGVAGATSDDRGRWSATTLPLRPGKYALTAVSLDSAGNKSTASPTTRVTILP